jgi:signal peptidase I
MSSGKRSATFTGFSVVLLFLLAFSIYALKNVHVVQVSGDSMLPTLKSGQRLLMSKAYWLVGPIQVNDIVVFKNPEGGPPLIKRVVGLGGDPIDFEIAPRNWTLSRGQYRVPEGMLYAVGDNHPVSEDSRNLGPFEPADSLGKVVADERDAWLALPAVTLGVVAVGWLASRQRRQT